MKTLEEIKNEFYSTDVADHILSIMIGSKARKWLEDKTNNKLEEELDKLIYEQKLLFNLVGTKQEQDDVLLKVFNVYAPQIKNGNY